MGCYVNIASADTRPKTTVVYAAILFRIIIGVVYFGMIFLVDPLFAPIFIGIGILEFTIGWWLWSLRIEAWGVAVGFSLFHILYPLILSVSEIGFVIIGGVVSIEILLLLLARQKGYYNFNTLAMMDPIDSFNASTVQRRMFNLVTIAQLIKGLSMFQGAYVLALYESASYEMLVWYGYPRVPMVIILGAIDIIAAVSFHLHRDWGFHSILVMAALSFAETVLSFSLMVFLLGIWIITLMMPCWVKWGFYEGLLSRYRKSNPMESVSSLEEISDTPKK